MMQALMEQGASRITVELPPKSTARIAEAALAVKQAQANLAAIIGVIAEAYGYEDFADIDLDTGIATVRPPGLEAVPDSELVED